MGVLVIGKVIRGTNVENLLRYLFGPGIANEHVDPHLVAGFGDPAELEPERLPDGTADVRRLAGLLNQPLAALIAPGFDKPAAVRAGGDCSGGSHGGAAAVAGRDGAGQAARVG